MKSHDIKSWQLWKRRVLEILEIRLINSWQSWISDQYFPRHASSAWIRSTVKFTVFFGVAVLQLPRNKKNNGMFHATIFSFGEHIPQTASSCSVLAVLLMRLCWSSARVSDPRSRKLWRVSDLMNGAIRNTSVNGRQFNWLMATNLPINLH